MRPSIFCRDRVPDFVWAPQAKRIHQILRSDFENYNFSLLLRGYIPLRHPLSPQVPKFCQSLILVPPLSKNPASAPEIHCVEKSKLILPTCDSFPLITSHMCNLQPLCQHHCCPVLLSCLVFLLVSRHLFVLIYEEFVEGGHSHWKVAWVCAAFKTPFSWHSFTPETHYFKPFLQFRHLYFLKNLHSQAQFFLILAKILTQILAKICSQNPSFKSKNLFWDPTFINLGGTYLTKKKKKWEPGCWISDPGWPTLEKVRHLS